MGTVSSDRPKADYSCTQQELYTIAENGWTSYGEHLSVFAAKRSIYTAQKGTDALAALEAAVALPDEAARKALHVVLRIDLVALGGQCRIIWDELDSMIRDSFPDNQYETRRNEAGHGFYAAASNNDWEATKALMKNGADFIAQHGAVLAGTEGGMLPEFPTDLGTVQAAFKAKYLEFKQAEELTKTLTDEKIEANNAVYRALIKLFADGRKYFRFNASVRHQFTFERLLAMISGSGGSGSKADMVIAGVIADINGNRLPGAVVRLSNSDSSVQVVADAQARYRIPVEEIEEPMGATLMAEHAGMMPSSRSVTLVGGEDQEQNFQLLPMAPVPPAS